jgi:regulator of protease activity HflC (stomatin/prohibitin superfamily)
MAAASKTGADLERRAETEATIAPRSEDLLPEAWRRHARDPRPWPYRHLRPRWARGAALLTIALLGVASAVLIAGVRLAREDSGHVGVVRNGGPWNNRRIRQILKPSSGLTYAGLFSQSPREYPAAKVVLFYTITNDPKRGSRLGADFVQVPTRDGVQVGLEGTVFFRFMGETDVNLLKRFDQTFGTRKFPVAGTDRSRYPWEGPDEGFAAMLDSVFRPVLDNNLRAEVGGFECADLVASCSLIRRVSGSSPTRSDTSANIAKVEQRISQALNIDLARTLGGNYFRSIRVRIAKVTLPENVQGEVNSVQQQYVAVNGARAALKGARYQAQRNELLARAYNGSPALAKIDEIRAAPKGSTIVLTSSTGKGKQPGINVGG